MSKTSTKIVIAFTLGQIAQIVFAILAKVSYMDRPVLFCAAAGFILLIAVFAGIWVAALDADKKQRTYLDYADKE